MQKFRAEGGKEKQQRPVVAVMAAENEWALNRHLNYSGGGGNLARVENGSLQNAFIISLRDC